MKNNKLVKPLHELLKWVISGDRTGNPYCVPEVKQAMKALKDETSFAGDWMDVVSHLCKQEESPVIFRKFKDGGDVIAVFPNDKYGPDTYLCYQHIGQHGDCNWSHIVSITVPAKEEEYEALKRELESIYQQKIVVKKRLQR